MTRRGSPDVSLTWAAEREVLPSDWPAMYASGLSIRQIAEASGHIYTRVRIELHARGVVMRPPSHHAPSQKCSPGYPVEDMSGYEP